MSRELKGWVRPRPIRVAFLVEDNEHSALTLDGVFADCYSRWGGRFSLIVPCADRAIDPAYWPWLEAYDPDVVYSYVSLSRAHVLEVHERLRPGAYLQHDLGHQPRFDVFGFKPRLSASPLSSLSVIFRLARYRDGFGAASAVGTSLKLIDSWHGEASRFLTDNLGTYFVSRSTSIYPQDARQAATLLTIISPENAARHGLPRDLDMVESEKNALTEFAHGRATSLSLASCRFAPKLEIQSARWSGSFNLVVGESFADRVLFWNARLLLPDWLDNDLGCLRVTLDQLRDEESREIIGHLINRHNHVNAGAGGQSQLSVRSVSLNAADLDEAVRLIDQARIWSAIRRDPVQQLSEISPTADELTRSREGGRFSGEMFPRPDRVAFQWLPPTARPPAIAPDHLADAPPRQVFTQGHWSADFVFEYGGDPIKRAGVNLWMLPSRWPLAGAFERKYVGGPPWGLPAARRCRDGTVGVIVDSDHPIETIKVPEPIAALRHGLAFVGSWVPPDGPTHVAEPPNMVAWLSPSNEARYLAGVLGLAGGLDRATQFLLHPYLKQLFGSLGASPIIGPGVAMPTANRLRKKARHQPTFDLRDDRERDYLAEQIVKAAREVKTPKTFVAYDHLQESWRSYRQEYYAAQGRQPEGTPGVDWDEREQSSLDNCLVELRRQQMLFQGCPWTCSQCHHRNWIDLAELSPLLTCQICRLETDTPIDVRWFFRPNEFLVESLRDHGVLATVWVMEELRNRAHQSLVFVGPTWFGYTPEAQSSNAEVDLIALLDGRALICEIKSSWTGLRVAEVHQFVALGKRLRPDAAILAVMQPETPASLRQLLDQARADLVAAGVTFELLTFNKNRVFDAPYL